MKLERLKALVSQMALETENEIIDCLIACFREYKSYSRATLLAWVREAMAGSDSTKTEKPSFRNKLKLLSSKDIPIQQDFVSMHRFVAQTNETLDFSFCITSLRQQNSLKKEGSSYFKIQKQDDLKLRLIFKAPNVGTYRCKISLSCIQDTYAMQIVVDVQDAQKYNQKVIVQDQNNALQDAPDVMLGSQMKASHLSMGQSLNRDNDSMQFIDFKAELSRKTPFSLDASYPEESNAIGNLQSENANKLKAIEKPSGKADKKTDKQSQSATKQAPHFGGYDPCDEGVLEDVWQKLQQEKKLQNTSNIDEGDGDDFVFDQTVQKVQKQSLKPRSKPVRKCEELLKEIDGEQQRLSKMNPENPSNNLSSITSQNQHDSIMLSGGSFGGLQPKKKKKGTKKTQNFVDDTQVDKILTQQKQKALDRTQQAMQSFSQTPTQAQEQKEFSSKFGWLADQNFPDVSIEQLIA